MMYSARAWHDVIIPAVQLSVNVSVSRVCQSIRLSLTLMSHNDCTCCPASFSLPGNHFLLAFVHTIDISDLLTGCPSITYKIQAVYKYCDF